MIFMMSRNFGIGSRNMSDAGRMILEREFHGGFQSVADIGRRWNLFCQYAAERGVKKMELVTREMVVEYGQELQRELDAGQRSSSSAPKNNVSAVNTVMRLATKSKWKPVKPGKDCGIQPRKYLPETTKAMSLETHESAQKIIGDRLSILMELQRTFGLRFKESCLLNPKLAVRQANKTGYITLTAGTKGGRKRKVPCRPCGLNVLEMALKIQDGKSMIPKNMQFHEFQKECYIRARTAGIGGFHSERHYYAQERYLEIVGAPAPIAAGWPRKERLVYLAEYLKVELETAKQIDADARLTISKELGHNRIGITNVYAG